MTPDAARAIVRDELSRFVDRLLPLLSPCSDAAEYHNRVQLLRGGVAPEVLTEEEAGVAVSAMSFKLRHHLKPLNSRTTSCELCGETWPMWQAGQAARDECPGTPEPDIDEPPEQWETVRGIELREGDTIRFSNRERLTLGARSSMRESPSGLWREFVVSGGFFILDNDQRFERLVRPEPKPVPEWPPSHRLGLGDLRDAVTDPRRALTLMLGSDAGLLWASELLRRTLPHVEVEARAMLAELKDRHG